MGAIFWLPLAEDEIDVEMEEFELPPQAPRNNRVEHKKRYFIKVADFLFTFYMILKVYTDNHII